MDIIGSIDEIITTNTAIINKLYDLINFIYLSSNCKIIKLDEIATIKTGKEDANHSTLNGKYKFFTCAEQPLNCDDYIFEGRAILLAGNGSFAVNHYNGKFSAYQRTYVIAPNDNIDYGLLYISTKLHIKSLLKASTGSIIKFIGIDDVKNIQIKNLSATNKIMVSKLLSQIDMLNIENETLKKYKNSILPMLLNEQII